MEGPGKRVFLSYTSELREFPDDRPFVSAAKDAITRAGCVPVEMSYFTSGEDAPAAHCRMQVRTCDAYAGLIGLRYGSRVPDEPGKSYTELEFDTASEAGLNRLVFLLDQRAVRLGIPIDRLLDDDPQDGWKRQQEFRARLQGAGLMVHEFSNPYQLEMILHQALLEAGLASRVRASSPVRLPPRPRLSGRAAEVDSLVAAWLTTPPEPVAVLGAPGIGKSAVCLAALHDDRVRDRFGTRRWFVRCDGAASAGALLSVLAVALGVIAEVPAGAPMDRVCAVGPADPLIDRVCAVLADGIGVLVLDNFETPWNADPLPVEELLGTAGSIPGVGVAITVRGLKHPATTLPWRDSLVVRSLPPPHARQLFLSVTGPGFAADPDLEGLLKELDGMPLAVELLGYVAQGEPDLAGVAQRWRQERIELLQRMGGKRPELSVAASLKASVRSPLMTGPARRLFGLLGVLPDGAARADLTLLLPDEGLGAAGVLRQLGLVSDDDGRMRMLAPVREYAAAAYLPEGRDLTRAVSHYMKLAAAIEEEQDGEKAARAAARLGAEMGNVTAMLQQATDSTQIDELVNGLCGLAQYWSLTGAAQPGILAVAEEAVKANGTSEQHARIQRAIGDLALVGSDYASARVRYRCALQMFSRAGDALGKANCVKGMGDIELALSDYEVALAWYKEALQLYQRAGSALGEANCIKGIGDIALACSAHETAQSRYEEALPLYREAGSVLGQANCIRNLGGIELERSDHGAALARYEEALALYQEAGSVLGEANCLRCLGDIDLARSDRDSARARYEQALELYQAIAEVSSIGWTHVDLARLEDPGPARDGHWDAACQAWAAIGRDELIESLKPEFQ